MPTDVFALVVAGAFLSVFWFCVGLAVGVAVG